jgi:hypothetical protein
VVQSLVVCLSERAIYHPSIYSFLRALQLGCCLQVRATAGIFESDTLSYKYIKHCAGAGVEAFFGLKLLVFRGDPATDSNSHEFEECL